MIDDGLDRGSTYRRRLARAAAASLALHMIFFGGLSVSRLDVAIESAPAAESKEPEKRKRSSDFQLQVSRSSPSEKPAHERPLSLAIPADAAPPTDSRERPIERSVSEQRAAAPETPPSFEPSRPEFTRSRSEDPSLPPQAIAVPKRVTDVTPETSQASADMAPAAAATSTASAPSAAPAATQGRDRGDAGPVAARWRPREVALLEKLTTSAPDASAIAARAAAESPAPAPTTPIMRRSATAATSPSVARAEALAPAATTAPSSSENVRPAARSTARRSSAAASAASQSSTADAAPASRASVTPSPTAIASVTRSSTAPASMDARATGSRSPGRSSSVQAGAASGSVSVDASTRGMAGGASRASGAGQLAPAAATASGSRTGRGAARGSALGRSGRGTSGSGAGHDEDGDSATASGSGRGIGGASLAEIGGGIGEGRESLVGNGTGGSGDGRSLGRDTGGIAAGAQGGGSLASVDPAGGGGTGAGGGTGTPTIGSGTGGSGNGLAPAPLARGGRRGTGRSAMASRGTGAGTSETDGDGEGLSVSAADVASFGTPWRDHGSDSSRALGARPLERVTATALPTDGRVRDVAQAFAGRSSGSSGPAGGISDRETIDRARAMVNRGLDFLVRSQLADGRWRLSEYAGAASDDRPKLDSDAAATGLALLCFLGAGHDHFSGPHRDTVRRGLEFLVSVQRDDGDLFLPADDLSNSCSWLYSHGIASIAMCEAVGMTGDSRLKPSAQKACAFIAATRHPTLGGWRYLPRTDADLSVSGWMLIALRAGDLAGVRTDPAALDGVRTLLAASTSPGDPSRYAYNPRKPEQRRTDLSVACMTAVGGLMRLHTGETPEAPGVVATAKALAGKVPAYGAPKTRARDAYLWYYASQVLVHTGGAEWQGWYSSLVDTLEPHQATEGARAGSWEPLGPTPDRWGEYGGRIYVTTLHLLALEVPWRHLPTYATAPAR